MMTKEEAWRESWAGLLPAERLSVSEFAEKNRWLYNEGGGYVGLWDNSIAPYLKEPMDCLNSSRFLTVAVVGPGQSGKTTIGENWLLKSVADDPGNFLWYMQNEESLRSYVKNRIDPMIDKHDFMKKSIGLRSKDDAISYKKFRTMDAQFLSATLSNLISKSAPRIIGDEIDAYAASVGNVKPLLDVRRQTFGHNSMLFLLSHPDLARGMNPDTDWSEGIMSAYADSDRRIWYWKCPHCGVYSSPCPISDHYMYLQYPEDGTLDEIEDNARLCCPINGCLIDDDQRKRLNKTGKWVGIGQQIDINTGEVSGQLSKRDTAGFWIVGVMSPFILGGIGPLARARVKAERDYANSGEEKTLRGVMTKQFGFPYVPPRAYGSVTANELADRAEANLYLREVPEGVRFLTAAFDVQIAHFDCLVRGWGVGGESWIIDRFRVSADTSSNPDDWDKMVTKMIRVAYPLVGNGLKMMPLRGVGFDSAGAPGVTRQAYDAWTRWSREKLVRRYAVISGREAWNVIPMKGANSTNAHRLTTVYPDTSSQKNRMASKGTVPVAMFNPNMFKDDLAGQLQRSIPGDWYVHYPYALRSKIPEGPHEWFEQLVCERRDAAGKWEKVSSHSRNEGLDLMVMTHAIAHLHGLSQINWERPPHWAAEWDKNNFLVDVESVATPAKKDNNSAVTEEPAVKIVVETGKKKNAFLDKLAR